MADYIWRTVNDGEVRAHHAEREGKEFLWDKPPEGGHPGEEYNCRCWAEKIEKKATGLKQTLISNASDSEKWGKFDFLWHFAFGRGQAVSLAEIGYLGSVIEHANQIVYKRLENQVANTVRKTDSNSFEYKTSGSYAFGSVHPYFGGGTIKTITRGSIERNANIIKVDANVVYEYEDIFTDPLNIRQNKYGTSSPDGISDIELLITDRGGTYYKITGYWETNMSGTIQSKN